MRRPVAARAIRCHSDNRLVPLVLDLPSLNDLWKIALAVVPIGLLLAGLTNAWLSARNERRRSQPVVIAHDEGGKPFSGELGGWVTRSYLTNEGGGPAFNVRSGIEIDGHRFPFRGVKDGQPRAEGRASLWRVVRVGERLPSISTAGSRQSGGAFLIVVDSETMAALGKNRGSKMHWCRYENAYGQTWETRNPVDPAAKMTIHRVRLPRRREWREERAELRLRAKGRVLDARLAAELRASAITTTNGTTTPTRAQIERRSTAPPPAQPHSRPCVHTSGPRVPCARAQVDRASSRAR